VLFIDANIYLEFFKSSQDTLKKLLPVVLSMKDEIFVTKQISDEVTRNKIKVAADSLRNYVNSYKAPSSRLPEHLEEEGKTLIGDWNKSSANLYSNLKSSQEALSDIVEHLLDEIMKGDDAASVSLEKVFENAVQPSDTEISNAKSRKEVGNPPGKHTDPIGDEISWEQLLSTYKGDSPLWIISADNDYSSMVNNRRYLNAYLFNELKHKLDSEPVVHVFDSLAKGIKHFSENRPEPVPNLPSPEELQEIAFAELNQRKGQGLSQGFPGPIECYKCGKKEGFDGPVPKPSQYGGWTYQWICNACHEWNDFGEPYDD
jgi:hypothetical protein